MTVAPINNCQAGQKSAEFFQAFSGKTDLIDRTIKVALPVFDIILNSALLAVGQVSVSLSNLKDMFSSAKSLFSAVSIFSRPADWVIDSSRRAIVKSWEKVANKVTLAVMNLMDFISFVDKVSYKFFSKPSNCLAGVPIFDWVKNSIVITSSAFGLSLSTSEFKKASRKFTDSTEELKNWNTNKLELASLDVFDFSDTVKRYEDISKTQNCCAEKAKAYISALTKDATDESYEERVAAFQVLKRRDITEFYKGKAASLRSLDKISEELSSKEKEVAEKELELKSTSFTKFFKLKGQLDRLHAQVQTLKTEKVGACLVNSYADACANEKVDEVVDHVIEVGKVSIHNAKLEKKKSWIAIAAEVSKMFVVIAGTAFVAVGSVYSVLKGNHGAIAMSSVGLIAASLGLTKSIYAELASKSKPVPDFVLA